MNLNAATRLSAHFTTLVQADAQRFKEGSEVSIVESFYFDDGKRSKRHLPGVVKSVGRAGRKERGVAGPEKFEYLVHTAFGDHTFAQDDLEAR